MATVKTIVTEVPSGQCVVVEQLILILISNTKNSKPHCLLCTFMILCSNFFFFINTDICSCIIYSII